MKKLIIPIHSFVDTITNSSTVIYVQCHNKTIELTKNLINTLLKIAGSAKTADDLFLFRISPTDYYKEMFIENEAEKLMADDNIGEDAVYEKAEEQYEYYLMNPSKRPSDWGEHTEYGWNMEQLELIPIKEDQETINLTSTIESIFSIDGTRDG